MCILGLMGQETTSFNPYGNLTTAQFGTILSRMLWWNTYDGDSPYYAGHLRALKDVWILRSYSNPTGTFETRGNIMLMLQRAYTYKINAQEFWLDSSLSSSNNSIGVDKTTKEERMILCSDSKGDLTLDRETSQWVYKYSDGSGLNTICSYMDNKFSCKNGSWEIKNSEISGFVCEDNTQAVSVTPNGFAVIYKTPLPAEDKFVWTWVEGSIDLTSLFSNSSNTSASYSGLVDDLMNNAKNDNSHLYDFLQLEKDYNKKIEEFSWSIEDFLNNEEFDSVEDPQAALDLINKVKDLQISANKEYKENLEALKKELNSNDKKYELEERIDETLEFIEITDSHVNSIIGTLVPIYEAAIKYGTWDNIPESVKEQVMWSMYSMIGSMMWYGIREAMYKEYLNEWWAKVYKELTGKDVNNTDNNLKSSDKVENTKTENQMNVYDLTTINKTTKKDDTEYKMYVVDLTKEDPTNNDLKSSDKVEKVESTTTINKATKRDDTEYKMYVVDTTKDGTASVKEK